MSLYICRKVGQAIVVAIDGHETTIKVQGIRGKWVDMRITGGPRGSVWRKEIWEAKKNADLTQDGRPQDADG